MPRMTLLIVLLWTTGIAPLWAQTPSVSEKPVDPAPGGPPKNFLDLGGGMVFGTEPYQGVEPDILPIPMVNWQHGPFYITGLDAGYGFFENDRFRAALMVRYDHSGYDEGDSETLDGMDDRRGTLLAGLTGSFALTKQLSLNLEALQDVLGTHDGQEFHLGIDYRFERDRLTLTPGVELILPSRKMIDYYYGVQSSEATSQRPAYNPHPGVTARTYLFITWRWTERVSLLLIPSLDILSREIRQSPLVDKEILISALAGITYRF